VDAVTRQFIGKLFTDELYGDLLNRIDALEFFDDVSSEILRLTNRANSIHIKFTVTERPVVDRLIFTGNRQVRTAEIKEAISDRKSTRLNSSHCT
jgi:outer membrane protein insertion porin family